MRIRTMLLPIALSAIFILLAFKDAFPECAFPRPFIALYPTTTVPPNPRLYLFVPQLARDSIPEVAIRDSERRPMKFGQQEAAGTGCYGVYVLSIETGGTEEFEIEVSCPPWQGLTQSFTVDTSWRLPKSQLGISNVSLSTDMWPCSFELSQKIRLDADAPVYEVQWSTTAEQFQAGDRESLFVPANLGWFFESSASQGAELNLGHINCLGYTLEWSVDTLSIGIEAVYPDGTVKTVVDAMALPRPEAPAEWHWK